MVKVYPPFIQEVWYRIQGWYKAAVDRAPPPARVTLKRITAERVALYSRVPPPGENIPVALEPFKVEDEVPEEGEIEWARTRRVEEEGEEDVAAVVQEEDGGEVAGQFNNLSIETTGMQVEAEDGLAAALEMEVERDRKSEIERDRGSKI